MATSFYEYTKSAKDVKKFVCEEKCREIALAFDEFNAGSGVYEFFGDVLLDVAKEQYEMTFESSAIKSYLKDKGLEPPEFEKIEIEEHWYDESQDIRAIGQKFKCDEVRPDYYWYTLWKIAKEYNGKNGCVVTQSPTPKYPVGDYFDMNWGEDARRITSDEVLSKEYEGLTKRKFHIYIAEVFARWILSSILLCIFGVFLYLFDLRKTFYLENIFITVFFVLLPLSVVFTILGDKKDCKKYICEMRKKFNEHSKNIQENRESRYYLD